MTQALRSYLLAIVAVSLLTAILLGLLPKGGVRRAAGLTCAMALAVVVLRPVAALDGESLARAIARLEWSPSSSARVWRSKTESLSRPS